MERYSEYKDSGVKWLGEIPSHWEPSRNKAIFRETKAVVGKNSKKFTLLSLSKKGVIARNLDDGGKFPAEFDTYKIVEPGDFIFCFFDVDETPRTIGLSTNKGMITGAYTVLKQNTANSRYLYYYYLSIDNAKALKPLYSGLRKTVPLTSFMSMQFFLPPKAEQDAIVRYLDAATSKIDKAIAMQQKMIDLLNERKQIIIQNAVTKGLYDKVEMKDSGVEWTEFFPNSWSIKKVKYIFEFISTKEVASNRTFNIALENIVAHSGNYIDTNSEYEASGVSFRKNDILFGKLRPYLAKVHLCERAGIALGDIFVLRPLSGFDSSFLRYLLISEKFIQYVDSSTYGAKMPRANWDFIGNIYVAYPTLDKQRDISKYLDKQMLRFDSAISNCQRQISLLLERKQIIINEVVTGKVKVS